jgi:HYDIN/CFA65/VesB-like, Ig-like domain/Abnormal spindle-like microcephaly-assoc'd, ASPM-SPD-2-Hydin/Cep192 domain 4
MNTHAQKKNAEIGGSQFQNRANPSSHRQVLPLVTLIAVLVSIVGLSSCAGYTTNAASTTTEKAGNASSGTLSASSSGLTFGSVNVGSNATLSLNVTNTGTATVNVSQAAISGAAFAVVGGDPASTIPAGQSETIQVRFVPQAQGAASGTLAIMSDATDSPLAIPLSGTGMQPVLTISPASLNFNNVTVGQTSAQTVTLTNSGNADLVLNIATVSGPGFGTSGLSLPKTLTAAQSLSFSVQFTPTSTSAASGSIVFTDNAPGSPQTLSLVGSAVAANGTLSANPGSYNFNSVAVGSSNKQTITLTNSGAATVTVNQVSTSGAGFSATGIAAGQTIAAGSQASFTATFAPATAGSSSGAITISTNASNPTLAIALSGTGTQGSLTANPSSINFENVLTGSSGSVSVTLSNSGTAPVSVSAASASGASFSITGFSPGTLNPGATSSFTVTFAPTAAGNASGSVAVTSNAPGSPMNISLTGSGTATQSQMTISPSSVAFNSVSVGSNATHTVTLTNTGNAALNITAATITGTGYTMSLTPTTISAGANTTFTVTFTPSAEGNATGSISIASSAAGSPATIALSGTGLQAQGSASPASVAFGSVVVGASNSDVITLKNNGNTVLNFSQVTVAGPGFSISGLSTSNAIAAGGTLNFNAVFTPTSTSSASGSIALTTNGSPAQLTIALAGTGAAPTLSLGTSPSSLDFGNVPVGTKDTLTSAITNTGNSNITISGVNVTGAGYTATGVTSGMILSPNQSATLTVAFAPTATGSATGSVSMSSNATSSPTTISLSGETHTVLLSWTASTSSGVTGYYIYRGTQSGQYSKLNPSSPVSGVQYTDAGIQAGTTYYYVVTAVNSAGTESSYSSPATVNVP